MIVSHIATGRFSFFRTVFPAQFHSPLVKIIMGLVVYPQGFRYNSDPWGGIGEEALRAARLLSMVFGSLTVAPVFCWVEDLEISGQVCLQV